MDKHRKFLKKVFCLPPLPTILIAVPSFIFVFIMLKNGGHPALQYLSYGLSAYALVITVTGFSDIVRWLKKGGENSPLMKLLRRVPVASRYLEDRAFRAEISLYISVAINFAYIFIKLFSGIYYRSVWFLSLSGYYMCLFATRFFPAPSCPEKSGRTGDHFRMEALSVGWIYTAGAESGAWRDRYAGCCAKQGI